MENIAGKKSDVSKYSDQITYRSFPLKILMQHGRNTPFHPQKLEYFTLFCIKYELYLSR